MAKFSGIPPVTGTIGPVCIYKMYGRYFMRTSNPLTRERVKKDPAFRKTMEYASLLAKASRIGSTVYAALPADKKQHSLYRKLTGEAMYWLKHNWSTEDVLDFLLRLYAGKGVQQQAATEPKGTVQRLRTITSGVKPSIYSPAYCPKTAQSLRNRPYSGSSSPPGWLNANGKSKQRCQGVHK